MLSTIYVTLPEGVTEELVRDAYAAAYAGEPFVYLLPKGQVATFGHTAHTNTCAIGLTFVPGTTDADRHIKHRQPDQRRVGAGGAEHECDVRDRGDGGADVTSDE